MMKLEKLYDYANNFVAFEILACRIEETFKFSKGFGVHTRKAVFHFG